MHRWWRHPTGLDRYEGATHAFDAHIDIEYLNHILKFNPEADKKDRERTKAFFDHYLLGK